MNKFVVAVWPRATLTLVKKPYWVILTVPGVPMLAAVVPVEATAGVAVEVETRREA